MRRRRLAAVLIAVAALAVLSSPLLPTRAEASSSLPQSGVLRGIPLAEYRARRSAAMASMPDGVIVLRGRLDEEFGDDMRYRQDNWFMYLSGVETPGAFLILNPAAKPGARETLYVPARDPETEQWTGMQIGPGAEGVAAFGFERVEPISSFDRDLRSAFEAPESRSRRCRLFTIVPENAAESFSTAGQFVERLKSIVGSRNLACELEDLRAELARQRRVKGPGELAVLRHAIEITIQAQRNAALAIAPSRYEYEIDGVIAGTFTGGGALRAGFPSIVGSGANATVLHYFENSKRIDAGDLVVIDIGAEFDYYTADITRTFPASGSFTKRQREIYQLVLDTQSAAAAGYKNGMTIADLNAIARETMRKSPLRDSSGRQLDAAFVHGLTHFLGMDVHDVGDVSAKLGPGDVITIEPGIYLPDERIGVRIEDDYLVTESGLVKLSASLPSTPDEIEGLMKRR